MRNRYVREKFKEMIHGYPERTPLSPQTVAVHNRDGYRVENVMFRSLPNFWVTGNLYLPTEGKAPFPGVISPCGHYPLARMDPEYQCVYVDLVKAGFVVLAYDPIGQGERRQYWNPATGPVLGMHNFVLGPHAHTAYLLSDSSKGYPETANIRGTLEFSSATPGQLSVPGLRFNPNFAFTSVPPLANAAAN